jgi:MFS family permease
MPEDGVLLSLRAPSGDARRQQRDVESPALEPSRWFMLCVLLVGASLPPLDFFIVNVALPSIQGGLHASAATVQLVISVYAGVYAAILITGGRLGDLYGRSRVFLVGIVGFALASACCGFAPTPAILVIGRALQGLTAAIMAPQALALIQAVFPDAEKPRALSLYGALFGLAAVIGQILGGVLISLSPFGLGWRSIFLINLPIVAGVLVVGLGILRATTPPSDRRLDLGGVVLSAATLACIIVPLTEGRERDWPLWAILMLVAAPFLAVLFWRYEARVAAKGGEPLVDPSPLGAPGLRLGLMATLFFYALAPFFLLLSIYLQRAAGQSAFAAGVVFSPFGIGFLLGPLATPWLIRRTGAYLAPLGMAIEVCGFVILIAAVLLTPPGSPPNPLLMVVVLFAIGFGLGLALPTLLRAVTGRVQPQFAGMIAGLVNSVLQVSASLSVAVIVGVYYAILGQRSDDVSVAHGFVIALFCMALCLTTSALLALRLRRHPCDSAPARGASPQ